MINGVSNYQLSAETRYLTQQMPFIEAEMKRAREKSMLLLGCGDGQALNELATKYTDWAFTGVDFNQAYIEQARRGAPGNVRYACCDFSAVKREWIGDFGMIASPGILSWICADSLRAVFGILEDCGNEGSVALFGYDSEFFWGELKGVREAFLSLWMSIGDMNQARMITHGLVRSMPISSPMKRRFLEKMLTEDESIRHWLLQPHWKPFFPSEIDAMMRESGYAPDGESLNNLSHLMNPTPYVETPYRKVK